MEAFLLAHEATIRLYALIGSFGLVALWESFRPLRQLSQPVVRRWTVNIALTVICNLLIHWVYPLMLIGLASHLYNQGLGLYTLIDAPAWIKIILSVLLIDFGRYVQHVLLHRWHWLWRLHRVHHADLDYDLTTGLRFHPLEAVFTTGFGLAIIALVAPPPSVVIIYEATFALIAMWTHGNIAIPEWLDRTLRKLIVTPGMHRIHHSVIPEEHNSNLSGIFSIWDRFFGTYIDAPKSGHTLMRIGLDRYRTKADQYLHNLLIDPFTSRGTVAEDSLAEPRDEHA